jgi:transposase
MARDVHPLVVPQGGWTVCGTLTHAQGPPEPATGSGPRFPARIGDMAGTHGPRRRLMQHWCAAVLPVPRSLGAMQKRRDRVAPASAPPDGAMATPARQAPVHESDAPSWWLPSTWQWLWVMVRETAACDMRHPHRAKAALTALIDAWAGSLVSDGDGVYPRGVAGRQTCLAPRRRTARGLAARQPPARAAWGAWALAELQRLCHMATAPPTGGAWRAWYARRCHLITPYHGRQDEAGTLARRRLRAMDSRGVFLAPHGVDPTNKRAERAWRFGVLRRKRSQGTASVKGNRWVERILSLKETCRLHARSTYAVLVEAVGRLCTNRPPDRAWSGQPSPP